MLSKKEREYVEDIEAFEDQYGTEYGKNVRHRLSKKAKKAVEDLNAILKINGDGREPKKDQKKRIMKGTDGNPALINRSGKTEFKIIFPGDFNSLIEELVRQNRKSVVKTVQRIDREMMNEARSNALRYVKICGIDELRSYLSCTKYLEEAGFDDIEEYKEYLNNRLNNVGD